MKKKSLSFYPSTLWTCSRQPNLAITLKRQLPLNLALSCWLSFMIIFAGCLSASAQIRVVADLNTNEAIEEYGSRRIFSNHVSNGSRSFFISQQYYGFELWTSDGTPEGTRLLKFSQGIADLEVSGGIAFFSALTDDHGSELWKTDGTPEGTVMVKDIFPGGGSSSPLWLTDVNGTLFFSANNHTNGRELWRSDGTPEGTQLVRDVKPGSGSSGVAMITALGHVALFVANDGTLGYELWKSDGTASGTAVVDINPSGNSSPSDITVAGGVAFFAAETSTTNRQLYKTDGTPAGTSLVKIIRPNYNARIANITAVNNTVFFEAFDAVHGAELWKSDGTAAGTVLVKDITPGSGSPSDDGSRHVDHLASINGKLFFTAVQDYYRKMWVSDGTAAGTVMPEYIPQEAFSGFTLKTDPGLAELNGQALFLAMTTFSWDVSLFKSNGTSISLVKQNLAFCACDIETSEIPGPPSPQFAPVNGQMFFFAGNQYWKTDGTAGGTVLIRDLSFDGGISNAVLADLDGTLLFYTAETGSGTNGLFKTNGTPESTWHVAHRWNIDDFTSYNGLSYFGASGDNDPRLTLFRTDGTAEGTIALDQNLIWPSRFTGSNGLMFFHAQGPHGSELYKTDGTPSGTVLVKDINPGAENHGHPLELKNVGNTLFFSAETAEHGRELWKSDGSNAGTTLVKDIVAGSASSGIRYGQSYGGYYYFQANDGVNGLQLWRSNGTAEGTVMVSNFGAGTIQDMIPRAQANGFLFFTTWNQDGTVSLWRASSSSIMKLRDFDAGGYHSVTFLASAGNNVLFLVKSGLDADLWRSNGTVNGTVRIKKFRSAYWFASSAVRDRITYFGLAGTIWRTDGSAEGTYSLPFYGAASQFTTSGPYVYFFGETPEYGSELFLIEEESASTASIGVASEHFRREQGIAGFPNPFRSTLTLRVDGPEQEQFNMIVLDSKGQEISKEISLPYNVDHTLGASWEQGMYFLRIRHGNVTSVERVVKVSN